MSVSYKNSTHRKIFILLALAVLLVGIATLFHLRKVKTEQNKSGSIPITVESKDKQTKPATGNPSSSTDQDTKSTNQKVTSSVAASGTVIAPSGTFVSNHKPGQNGTSTSLESVCTTTPGATCFIQFTKGDVVKKLDAKTVDGTGSVTWNWDIKGANLGPGSWQITAVASLNGQTKKTIDPNGNLEVN